MSIPLSILGTKRKSKHQDATTKPDASTKPSTKPKTAFRKRKMVIILFKN
jgi:hypothetical protein